MLRRESLPTLAHTGEARGFEYVFEIVQVKNATLNWWTFLFY